ncbi:MAG: hypothetical protein SOV30_02570, partial [Dialister sp.]|nr:hypothetical protein [Dialister sp.]
MEGYIKLSRRLLSSDIWFKPPLYLKVWIYLLCQASHQDYGALRRGQLVTSIPKIQEALSYRAGFISKKPSYKEIWQVLEYMRAKPPINSMQEYGMGKWQGNRQGKWQGETEPMILTKRVKDGMLVTVVKYDQYQDAYFPPEQCESVQMAGKTARANGISREGQNLIDEKKGEEGKKKYTNTLSVNSTR